MLECKELTILTIPELTARADKTAKRVIEKLTNLSFTLALAESCTAGLISNLIANIPGASNVLWGSFVCYTQEAKISMLGLDSEKLKANGLVSRETACSMAAGALEKSGANIAASVTGLAGPGGDGSGVSVGTIWIAAALRSGKTETRNFHFTGERNYIRLCAATAVLKLIENDLT